MKARSTAMTQRPRDRVSSGSMLASHTQEVQTEQIHQQTFDDSFFWQHWHDLHVLGSHWIDSQQGILCWGYKGNQEEIPSHTNATETYGTLKTDFRPSCMNQASVFECHKRFKESGESVRDDERCGRSKEVRTPELISQRVRVRVTMLRF